MKPTYRRLRRVMKEKGYAFFEKPMSINIIGVRSNTSNNSFDDYIYIAYINDDGVEVVESFHATTKPGRHWLLNPLNSRGTAILMEGQYRGAYKIGVHNRSRPSKSYEALEQKSNMKYFRDNNKDSYHDYTSHIYIGNFKTNIHRSGRSGWSKFVDKWSAGCQVITGVTDSGKTMWERFMEICNLSVQRYGNSLTYTLLNEDDVK